MASRSSQRKLRHENRKLSQELAELRREARPAQIGTVLHAVQQTQIYQGPLPSPEIFAGYREIVPSMPERILIVFEEQSRHRMKLERSALLAANLRGYIGQIAGFSLGVIGLVVGGYLIYSGHDWGGWAISGTVVGSLAVAFVRGRSAQAAERSARLAGAARGEADA